MSARVLVATCLLLLLASSCGDHKGGPALWMVRAQCSGGYNCDCIQCADAGYSYWCSSNQECYSYDAECGVDCNAPCENVVGCTGCHQGYNCSCTQCQQKGYGYYCTTAHECYDTETSCDVSCGEAGCLSTQTCAPPMKCPNSNCQDQNSTCCIDSNLQQFCVPGQVTCCDYENMTCPIGTTCDPPQGTCEPPPPTPSSECLECQKVMTFIEQNGCTEFEDVCSTQFPELLCTVIVESGLCNYIIGHMLPAQNACEMIGFCGGGTCPCGYCNPTLYGQWCLSVPNVCPGQGAAGQSRRFAQYPFNASSNVRGELIPFRSRHQHLVPRAGTRRGADVCLDGWCDASSLGCCLTCA